MNRQPPIPDILKHILQTKAQEIAVRSAARSLAEISAAAQQQPAPRGFRNALQTRIKAGQPAVIAEIKKASPSQGIIRHDFDPARIAETYAANGATALSVLTDAPHFHGHEDFLLAARNATTLPILRKDFIIDPWQVHETRALGADCLLLIVAALTPAQLADLHGLAIHTSLDVLVEVHNKAELDLALALSPTLIGINNRDLHTFQVSLQTTLDLIEHIPADTTIVTESGIRTHEDIRQMRRHGIHTFLIGEHLMRAPDPGAELNKLFFNHTN